MKAEDEIVFRCRQYDPRTGAFVDLPSTLDQSRYEYQPPDQRDWVLVLVRNNPTGGRKAGPGTR